MNYKDEYKHKIQENLKNVLKVLDTEDMKIKISNWANNEETRWQ